MVPPASTWETEELVTFYMQLEKENIPGFGLWPALELVVYLRKGGRVYPPLQMEHSPAGRVQELGEL